MTQDMLGYVLGGSLQEGLTVRLQVPPYRVHEGAFVVMDAPGWRFFGIVIDVALRTTHPRYVENETPDLAPALTHMLRQSTLYTTATVLPVRMMEIGPDPEQDPEGYQRFLQEVDAGLRDVRPMPVKTVPPHFSPVRLADQGDVDEIFGRPTEKATFVIGYTREQGHAVRIRLREFIKRSAGVFGATGTGKSFLTRLLLAGIMHYDVASVLLFDMHNEYAYDLPDPDRKVRIDGLKSHFHSRIRVVGLGPGTLIQNRPPDYHLQIPSSEIQPADIELLIHALNLPETASLVLHALYREYGDGWFEHFRSLEIGATEEVEENGKTKTVPAENSVEAWAKRAGMHPESARAVHRRLRLLFDRDYIAPDPPHNTLQQIIRDLQEGRHVILSFGKYESELDYLLVTNLITRKVREAWVDMTERHRAQKDRSEPRPLVVVIEEAHKLLSREMAVQTIFSTIAREMRKYYVTLLIVDQRPSQIYDEVMSQLGTRISGWLGDEEDIRAVLAGLANRDALRNMLAHLEPREEALVMGWGVPLPIVVRTRRYDETFWQELQGARASIRGKPDDLNRALFG